MDIGRLSAAAGPVVTDRRTYHYSTAGPRPSHAGPRRIPVDHDPEHYRLGNLGASLSSHWIFLFELDFVPDMSERCYPWKIDEVQLLPASVHGYVPEKHLSRFIVALVSRASTFAKSRQA